MNSIWKSFVIAMSTYSKVPMPNVKWDEKSMKYSMCFFPIVGAIIAAVMIACSYVFSILNVNEFLKGAVYTAIPILLTGGIHMDGFMDTVDAKSSYKSKEERLQILKDPHAGAFAIIYCCLYLLVSAALFSNLEMEQIIFVGIGFVYSRMLSGFSVVTFKKAKKDGMLSDTANRSAKSVKIIMCGELFLLVCLALGVGLYFYLYCGVVKWLIYAMVVLLAGILTIIYYAYVSKKWFGGITGDLAGYFLQVCEFIILTGIAMITCYFNC